MNKEQMALEIKEMIGEVIEMEEFGMDENFIRDLGVDSMLSLEMVVRLEKHFGITITEQYLTRLQSVNEVVDVVMELLEEKLAKGVG